MSNRFELNLHVLAESPGGGRHKDPLTRMGKEGKEGKESKKRKSAVAEAPVVATVPLKVETEAEGVTGALLACFADAPPPEEATHGKGEISFECSRTPAGPRRRPSMQPTLTQQRWTAVHHLPGF